MRAAWFCAAALVALLGTSALAQSSPNYRLGPNAVSSGVEAQASAAHRLEATVDGPVGAGRSTSANHALNAGFQASMAGAFVPRSPLLWRNNTSGDVYRMAMNGFAVAQAGFIYHEPNTAWKIVAQGDFDGDGQLDLLWRNGTTGQVYLLRLDANGLPVGGGFIYTEPNAAWKIVHAPDIDGDGKSDILWWNSSTGQVYAMLMNGTTITAQNFVYVEPDTNWKIVAVGDFAGSGKANQLLWRNSATGQVFLMTVHFAAGAFTQTGAMIYIEPNLAWRILGSGDFNGDGRSDILWRNNGTGQVYLLLMNGSAIASQGFVYTEPNTAWKIVALGDYDGDARSDLLWRNDTTGQVYLMRMNGLAISSQSMIYTEPSAAWRLLGAREYGIQSTVLDP